MFPTRRRGVGVDVYLPPWTAQVLRSVKRAYQELADLGELVMDDLSKPVRDGTSKEVQLRKEWLFVLASTPRGVGHREEVRGVAVSSDGQTVASASRDNTIGLWSVASGRAMSIIRGHRDGVWCVDFSPQGLQLVSGGGDHVVRIWDTKTLVATHEFTGHGSTVHDVKFSHAGDFIVSAGGFDHEVRVWSIGESKCLHQFGGHADAVVCLDIASDDQSIASGDYDGRVYIWDLATGQQRKSFQAHRGVVRDVAFFPGDANQLLTVGDDGLIRRWNLNRVDAPVQPERLQTGRKSTRGGLCSLEFAPDGKSFVVGGRDGRIHQVMLDDLSKLGR